MIPKIHAKGHSFAGAANYVLHDKDRATTDDRVEWTMTLNLATQDPHVAWRIMVATALDQDRLKEQAGVKKTGRKSSAHVLHYTLSWHEDEAEGLTREEMLHAAEESLAVLGRKAKGTTRQQFAIEHQALIVCHNDEPQPHVHIIVNRVHPEHGIMLTTSKDRLNLSRWAEAYERERGKILCEERVKNNEARDKGEYVRSEKDKPQHIHELEAKHADRPDADRIRREQQKKDLALTRLTRKTKQRHKDAWQSLRDGFLSQKDATRQQADRRIARAEEGVHKDYEAPWKQLYSKHRRELVAFGKREKRFLGRIQNAIASIDFRAILKGNDRGSAIRGVFAALASKGVRLEAIEKSHLRQTKKLESRQRGSVRKVIAAVRKKLKGKLATQRKEYLKKRETLVVTQEREQDKLKQSWYDRRQDRLKAWNERVAVRDFNAAARNVDPRKGRDDQRSPDRKIDPRRGKSRDTDRGRGRDRSP